MRGGQDHSPEAVPGRIKRILDEMKARLQDHADDRLRDAWRGRWAPALLKIVQERETRPRVEIALVGGTGAGKSTLLNALLDSNILPVSNMRACTAAISEVSYANGPEYRAEVEFISRTDWQKELNLLIADVRDGDVHEANEQDAIEIPKVAKDKLAAVYGPWERTPSLRDLEQLQEPPEVRDALDRGAVSVCATSLQDFRKRVKDFLDSKSRFWPIVKRVRVTGPFPVLASGATIVDLPGINDPSEAREAVTKRYLKESRFVWIVFNIKRILTKDISNLMQSDDFLRQIVMDGREHSLTFVGTAADDLDIDSAAEELGLGDDASGPELALARNKTVRHEISVQVTDLARRLAKNAESPDRASVVQQAFQAARVFTVSALDYLALAKLGKNTPLFANITDTEVVQLREHMVATCRAYGVEAQARDHHSRIDGVLHEINAEIAALISALDQQGQLTAGKRKEFGEAVKRLSSFLQRDLAEYQERFSQDLSAGAEVLRERVKRATERAHAGLGNVKANWSHMHWATLRAVARRGGRYVSPTSGEHDFAADVSKPILDGITFAWTDFFGDRLTAALERWSEKLVGLSERFGADVLKTINAIKTNAADLMDADFRATISTTEQVIEEQVGQIRVQMDHQVREVRRNLYEAIPEQISENMTEAFLAAAQERGTGMKQRMLARIFQHADTVLGDTFEDIEERLAEGVRALNALLGREYQKMTATVTRHGAVRLESLSHSQEESVADVERRRQQLGALQVAIRLLFVIGNGREDRR